MLRDVSGWTPSGEVLAFARPWRKTRISNLCGDLGQFLLRSELAGFIPGRTRVKIPSLDELDLEAQVGQCFMVGYPGQAPDPELVSMLERGTVGGVILFARNGCAGPAMREQIARIRSLSPEWPLIAMDQEGGPVLRVSEGASDLPSAMAMGSCSDPQLVQAVGRAAGLELLSMGADLNLAPVLDVNRLEANPGIGLRSFGTTSGTVIRMAGAYLRGLQGSGVLACGKHFPGKGAAATDAHLSMPVVNASREELEGQDLAPFRELGQDGVQSLEALPLVALMTSHVLYPALDPERPGTTSQVIGKIAREILGEAGLLISDDLEMGGMADAEGCLAEGARRSLEVGHDLLLVCHDRDLHQRMVDHCVEAVRTGCLSRARIREACGRVLAWKRHCAALTRGDLETLVEEHRPLMQEAHLRGITLLQGEAALDPSRSWTVYLPKIEGLVQVEEGTGSCECLRRCLAEFLPDMEVCLYSPREGLEGACPVGRHILFCSYNAHLIEAQAGLLRTLAEGAESFSLVALRNPFDARLVPEAERVLLVHGFRRGAQRAVAQILAGKKQARGNFAFREGNETSGTA
jgi:beta-N-acetylhexosaminidase